MFDDGNRQDGEGRGFRSRKPRKAKEQDRDVNEAPVARKRPSMPDYRDVREEQSKRDAKEQRKEARGCGPGGGAGRGGGQRRPAAIAAARREQEEKDKRHEAAAAGSLSIRPGDALLKIRDRSETELRRKYREKKVELAAVDEGIAKLKTMGMLNDKTFANAKAVVLVNRGKHGPKMIAARLAAAAWLRRASRRLSPGRMGGVDELAMAREALKKKHPAAIGTKDQKAGRQGLPLSAEPRLLGLGCGQGGSKSSWRTNSSDLAVTRSLSPKPMRRSRKSRAQTGMRCGEARAGPPALSRAEPPGATPRGDSLWNVLRQRIEARRLGPLQKPHAADLIG